MKQHNYNISIPATIGDTIYLTNEEEKAKLPCEIVGISTYDKSMKELHFDVAFKCKNCPLYKECPHWEEECIWEGVYDVVPAHEGNNNTASGKAEIKLSDLDKTWVIEA